ncbi:MAG: polysaccharide deacetylase family protein [Desulfobacula sp.]|nr:polysaccharide deacetylase family protein [Desulfobacula sp.]
MTITKHTIKRIFLKTKLYKLNHLKNQFYVLPYHSIVEKPNGFYPENDLLSFKKEMAHLAQNYTVIDFKTLVERLEKKQSLRGYVVITFDDGFLDNYELVYPVLKQYKLPATIFLTTDFINKKSTPWFIKFRYAFMETPKNHIQIKIIDTDYNFPTNSKIERKVASDKVMSYMRSCPEEQRDQFLNTLYEILEIDNFKPLENLMLNWDQIREMSDYGISFGAHTVSHPVLSQISIESAKKEIKLSKEIIEAETKKQVYSFAYPFGKKSDFSQELIPIIKQLGFKCAVTTETGKNNFETDLFALNRNFPFEMSVLDI